MITASEAYKIATVKDRFFAFASKRIRSAAGNGEFCCHFTFKALSEYMNDTYNIDSIEQDFSSFGYKVDFDDYSRVMSVYWGNED